MEAGVRDGDQVIWVDGADAEPPFPGMIGTVVTSGSVDRSEMVVAFGRGTMGITAVFPVSGLAPALERFERSGPATASLRLWSNELDLTGLSAVARRAPDVGHDRGNLSSPDPNDSVTHFGLPDSRRSFTSAPDAKGAPISIPHGSSQLSWPKR